MKRIVLLVGLVIVGASCEGNLNITAPCQTVIQRDTTMVPGDTVYVITVSADRCPR